MRAFPREYREHRQVGIATRGWRRQRRRREGQLDDVDLPLARTPRNYTVTLPARFDVTRGEAQHGLRSCCRHTSPPQFFFPADGNFSDVFEGRSISVREIIVRAVGKIILKRRRSCVVRKVRTPRVLFPAERESELPRYRRGDSVSILLFIGEESYKREVSTVSFLHVSS